MAWVIIYLLIGGVFSGFAFQTKFKGKPNTSDAGFLVFIIVVWPLVIAGAIGSALGSHYEKNKPKA